VLVAAGNGDFPDLASAVRSMVRVREVDPQPGAHERYAEGYAKWMELNARLDEMSI
jgi:hypothetical protein